MSAEPLLEVDGLEVGHTDTGGTWMPVLDGVSFAVGEGERVGLVGASGSGKSLTALSILGLVPAGFAIRGGSVRVGGEDRTAIAGFRGGVVGLVMQEAGTALNPTYSIGFQLVETIRAHRPVSRREAAVRARKLLEEVALGPAGEIVDAYPHQLSGGQAQRAMIALALAGEPRLVLADEPTTALDVVTQARIVELLTRICNERGLGLLLISHDLALLAGAVDRILVLHGGRIVERGSVAEVLADPAHPETERLAAAARRLRSMEAGR